jgi:hypothetical protein
MKDNIIIYMLYQIVDEANFEKIASTTIAKEAWDTLEKAYKSED